MSSGTNVNEPQPSIVARIITISAVSALALLAIAAVALWSHYGTTVFFETIRAGIAACF